MKHRTSKNGPEPDSPDPELPASNGAENSDALDTEHLTVHDSPPHPEDAPLVSAEAESDAPRHEGAFTLTPDPTPISHASAAKEPEPTISLEERIRRLEASLQALREAPPPVARPVDIPVAKVMTELPSRVPPRDSTQPAMKMPALGRRAWLLWELFAEARAILRMLVDPRYDMTWMGKLLPLGLLFLYMTSFWWMPLYYVPVIGAYLDKLVDLLLAFVLFKVLGHEARRYREVSPDLPASLRL